MSGARQRQTLGFLLTHQPDHRNASVKLWTWDKGKQTQHVTCWLDVHTLAILPAITASLLPPRLPHKSHTAAGLTGCFVADTAARKSLGQQEGKRQTNRSAFPSFRHSL